MSYARLLGDPMLAQISKWKRLGDGLRGRSSGQQLSDLWPFLVGLAVAGVAAYVFVLWRRRNDMSLRCNNPDKLFRQLCQTHAIEPESKRLLRQLAEARGFSQPALLFVTPDAFDPTTLPPQAAELRSHLSELKQRLF